MVNTNSISKVMVIFLGLTLVSSSFTAFSAPVLAASPGSFIDTFVSAGSGGLDVPKNLEYGPDGNLYVLSFQNDKVKRYDGTTGAFIDTFVASGSGGLDGPQGLEFGPDDNLYVTSEYTNEVLRYDGSTGAFIDVFVSGGLSNPQESIFGPDGNLYVSNYFTDTVVRFDGISGAFIDVFVSAGSGGLDTPQGLAFGLDDNLYVASEGTDQVLRYDGTSGSFIDTFVSDMLHNAKDITFGPDGNLYGTDNLHSHVKRYDGSTGVEIDHYVSGGTGGLDSPQGLVFGADDKLYVTSQSTDEILRFEGPFGIPTATCEGHPATIEGTSGDDILDGTSGDDVIVGFDGDDIINGLGGNDVICGGLGNDDISGGMGDDIIDAGDGDNYIEGEQGADTITAGSGNDTIYGGNGIDTISAGDGDNYIEGNQANDVITAGSGNDEIFGGNGDDCINSIGGTDTIDVGLGINSVNEDSCGVGEIIEDATTLVCHFPPGNPSNYHQIMIGSSALSAHKSHGDTVGKCVDDDEQEKRLKIIKIKKQREETRDKNELKEKRSQLKEIKKDLKNLKKDLNDIEKQKMKNLIDDIKDVIKKLKEDPEYDKEYKKIIKDEIKEIKQSETKGETENEKIFKNKVDSKINKLLKSNNLKKDAKKLGLDYNNGEIKIVIKLNEENRKVLRELSSISSINTKNGKNVQVTITPSNLQKLSSISGIEKIRSPFPAVQFDEPVSEGVYFMNADLAQYAGITGKGIKVAVMDLEFASNKKISDNISYVQSFRHGEFALPIDWGGDKALHGTAVAEIITDVAPNVELYLYAMESDLEFVAAVDQAISQEVDVIAMSAGWPNFPTDGTSHITKKIEEAVDNGIVFVVPAGNFGNKHWEGNFLDSNYNNWHEFTNEDEGLSIQVTQERITEEKPIIVHLMWDEGLKDVADFELILVDPLGQIVDYSANKQITKSDTAFEYIHHIPDTEGVYSIGVLYAGDMSDVSKRPNASLEIFSVNDELEYPVAQSSVSVPADANGAIVVGAVNHLDGKLEPFSSQGPTNNGKLAPHVVGPDGVSTSALNGNPFFGTSATTPYVAGLAALILETNPNISPEQILNEIQQNTDSTLFSLQNEYDYAFGYGSVSAIFLVEEPEVLG